MLLFCSIHQRPFRFSTGKLLYQFCKLPVLAKIHFFSNPSLQLLPYLITVQHHVSTTHIQCVLACCIMCHNVPNCILITYLYSTFLSDNLPQPLPKDMLLCSFDYWGLGMGWDVAKLLRGSLAECGSKAKACLVMQSTPFQRCGRRSSFSAGWAHSDRHGVRELLCCPMADHLGSADRYSIQPCVRLK